MTKCVDIKKAWDFNVLCDWYINSVDETEEPKWTPEHIEELTNDFYVIPKRKEIAAPIINTPEWISVKDRLPDAEGRYIVYATISKAYNVRYYGCLNWTGNAWDCSFGANITHWMTLPEPPEGE